MSEKRFDIAYGGNVITDEDGRDLDLSVKWCVEELVDKLNEQQATIENLRKWLIAEQKQVEKRDAFIKQKGLMSEFVKELEDEWETI